MEELAKEMNRKINNLCIEYWYFKQTNVIEKVVPFTKEIQMFLDSFLQGNVFGMEEEEYQMLLAYVAGVAADYVEALEQRDGVLMIDTLDYGLRELLNIYVKPEEKEDGQAV